MKKNFIFIISILLFVTCQNKNEKSLYSYDETVELYGTLNYHTETIKIMNFLKDKYDLTDEKAQEKYLRTLENIPLKKWKQFLKDTIDQFIKIQNKWTIKYFETRGHEKGTSLFNDNFRFDPDKIKFDNYWKVYYFVSNYPRKVVMKKEYYENNKLKLRVHYSEFRKKIKQEEFLDSGEVKTIYFGIKT